MSKHTVVWIAVFCLVDLAACGGSKKGAEEEAASATSEPCLPGSVYSCVRWNCSGFQRCNDDGNGLMPCTCLGQDDGGASDAAVLIIDAGRMLGEPPRSDAGAQPPTAAMTPADAGQPGTPTTPKDAGTSMPDAGKPPTDAGAPQTDAGAPQTDAGAPQTDAGAPASTEQCDNGTDDDGDGLPDCTDPDCGKNRCVAAAPKDWRGPVAFRVATEAVSCMGEFDKLAFEAGDQPEAEPATCTRCSCSGGCSSFLEFGTSDAAACGGTSCTTSVNSSCAEIAPQCLQGATTASLKTSLPAGSGCTATPQEATLPPARWKTRVTACEATTPEQNGCDAQQLCLPAQPSVGFEGAYCIWREGQHSCTGPTFTRQRLYYRGMADTRACTDCSCAASSCNYNWQVFNIDDVMCSAPLLQLSAVDQCAQINPEQGRLRVGAAITGTGTCTASGGLSRGTVAPSDAITMCCDN